jgi:hypothetical protein
MLEFIFIFALVVMAFYLGYKAGVEVTTDKMLDAMESMWQKELNLMKENSLFCILEYADNMFFLYTEDNKFVGNAPTLEELAIKVSSISKYIIGRVKEQTEVMPTEYYLFENGKHFTKEWVMGGAFNK